MAVGLLIGMVALTAASTSLAAGTAWWGERLEVNQDVFGFVPELATALVIAVGGYVAWRRVKAAERRVEDQIEATRVAARTADAATEQARVARASLVTEQFAKAIEQISSHKLMERVGGIHTLERLAHDDQPDGHHDDGLDEGSLAVTVTQVLFGHLRGLVGPTEDDEREVSEVERSTLVRTLARLPKGCTGHIDAPGINLAGANLSNIGLAGATLRSANLTDANLRGANLRSAELFGANLNGANLNNANLRGTNLTRANLTDATLTDANLGGANLTRANLTSANLTRANLGGARLALANLIDATLNNANLRGANLTRANLRRADLNGADLTLANLSGAIGLPNQG